jgi:hypothetical protein
VGEPLPLHWFSKGDASLFQHAPERYPFKVHGTRRIYGRGHLDVRQRFEVSATEKHRFPGIILNGQLALEDRAAEDQGAR